MARIPDEEIGRLVPGFGIELRRRGADPIGRCPFHENRTPSLVVSPKTNLWHCLGACNAGGSVIDWVMKTRGVSFRYAVELLKSDHASLAAGNGHVVRRTTATKLGAPIAPDADDREILRQVVDYYHETLKESPEALRYLESRGLTHPEMIDRFRLGFANRTLGYRLPEKNRKSGAEMRGRLQKLGILRESGHEHMNGSVVFPIIDSAGDVLGMYGRKITPNLREGTPLHTYLPGPHRGVWNEEALIASKEIILCESIIDALTFWCAGFRNVTASYGVNGFTDDHRDAFRRHGVEQVWIAYDRDDAGDAAADRLKAELLQLGIGSHRVLFPHGCDANEYALKVKPAAQSLAVLLNGATFLEKPQTAAKEEMQPVIPLAAEPEIRIDGDEITVPRGDRRYRIRGLAKNLSPEVMKVNVLVSRREEFHVDTLDLQMDRQRAAFIRRAAEELGLKEEIIRKDVGQVFLSLERLQSEQIRKALEPAQPEIEMSEEERTEALALLQSPNLLERIVEDFDRCGLVGEKNNKLIAYLAAVSRHLESPLAVLVQSSSAAGKSALMDAVLAFVPEEECIRFSAMTEQSLYYMGDMDLRHKVLAIAEEEGASRAAYALKLLQSEGALSIASTGKDPATGRLVTHQYRVEGPVMMFLTTTAVDIDEELLNRCVVLSVDEDREQTQAIHRLQREQQTLEGLVRRRQRAALIKLHQNAQRLLKPLFVVNPFVDDLTFPDTLTRMRRDHMKYLTLIRAIALLHQHQRPVRTTQDISCVEATREDIAKADELFTELLRRSLDELPPQTRRLLGLLQQMAAGRGDFRFSRRDVREHTHWGMTQVRVHLDRLEQMEYIVAHHGGRGLTFVYELVYDANLAGFSEGLAGPKRPQNGGLAATWRGPETRMNTTPNGVFAENLENRVYREA